MEYVIEAIDAMKYFYSHRLSAGQYTRNIWQWRPLGRGTGVGGTGEQEWKGHSATVFFEPCKCCVYLKINKSRMETLLCLSSSVYYSLVP